MTVVELTKYLVTVTTNGYGKHGKPMREIINEVVNSDEIGMKLEDAFMIGAGYFQAGTDKRLTITVERI